MSTRLSRPLRVAPDALKLFAGVEDEQIIGLAVSGGADSLALLVLVHRWLAQRGQGPKVVVYSVDHGLRPEAAEEAAMAVRTAQLYGFAGRVLEWIGDKPAAGVQEAAREARYRLIAEAMAADGATVLLTAHHLDDQAETVMMRMAHGSGLDGLRGMERLSQLGDIVIMRPLLGVRHADLLEVVAADRLVAAQDPSNGDEHYERVRWRQVLPQLEGMGLDAETIGRFATRIGEAHQAIAAMANVMFEEGVRVDGFGAARIAHEQFSIMAPAIATQLLRRLLNIAGGRQKPRALGQVEALRDELMRPEAFAAKTLMGCIVREDAGDILIAREPGRMSIPRFQLPPLSDVVWDDRFIISNISADTEFSVGVVPHIQRRKLNEFLGFKVNAPAEAIRTAPMVRDAAENILALGGWVFDDRITVQLMVE